MTTLRELLAEHPEWIDLEIVIYGEHSTEHEFPWGVYTYQPNDEEWADQRERPDQPKPAPILVFDAG